MHRPKKIRRRLLRRMAAPEALEDRLALDADELLWGVDARLSISFAADGAQVAGDSSQIFNKFNALFPTEAWQDAILRGFQTWARLTNADVGVVAEDQCVPPVVMAPGPCPFGTPGALQQDPRFGDVRVGAIPLDNELYAVSISSAEAIDGTWAGDVLFNSNRDLTIDELFRVALHEAGHVFGLEHSDDPQSPMHTHGIPVSVVPTPQDIAALHAIFGAREQDVYDQPGGGGADPLGIEISPFKIHDDAPNGSAPTVVFADILDQNDRDIYVLDIDDIDGYNLGTLTFQIVTSGISQLSPRMELLRVVSKDPLTTQQIIPDAGFANPVSGAPGEDLEIRVTGLDPQDELQIVVDTPSPDLSGTGGYTLLIWYEGLTDPTVTPFVVDDLIREPIRMIGTDELEDFFEDGFQLLVNDDGGSNDLPGTETEFNPPPGSTSARYQNNASIEIPGDVDRYLIRSPKNLVSGREMATVLIRSADTNFAGLLTIYDEHGATLTSETLVQNEQTTMVQFGPLLAELQYFVKVDAAANSTVPTGSYEFVAVMGTAAIQRTQFVTGSLLAPTAVQQYTLRTHRPQLFQFALSADSAMPGDATVRMEIFDIQGNLVEFLETRTGETRSKSILLPTGHFRVQFRVTNGSVFPVTYSLKGSAVDNPLGPRINNGSVPYTFVRVRGTFVPVVALAQ